MSLKGKEFARKEIANLKVNLKNPHLFYKVEDVDKAVAELKKRGIKNSEKEGNMPYYLLSDKDFKEVFE